MSDNPSPIQHPNNRRLVYIGGTTVACALSWLAAIGTAPTSAAQDMPFEIFMVFLTAAGSLTVVSVYLGISYANLKACTDNQRSIATAIGALAAEQEQENQRLTQLAERMGRIDPWAIYTAVYEDLLKHGNN